VRADALRLVVAFDGATG